MQSIKSMMDDRESEIQQYIAMLEFLEMEIKNGLPKIVGIESFPLETTHLHIFKANQYLLLYNYIEAVITQSLKKLAEKIKDENKPITDFIEPIQKEWLLNGLLLNDYKATPEARLKHGLNLLQQINQVSNISISKGGGGNFNNDEIAKLAKRLKIPMEMNKDLIVGLRKAGKRTYQKEDSCMKEITRERNKLAHGEITFSECGKNCDLETLRDTMNTTFLFMRHFVKILDNFITQKQYLIQ